jgi:hypothetical protein
MCGKRDTAADRGVNDPMQCHRRFRQTPKSNRRTMYPVINHQSMVSGLKIEALHQPYGSSWLTATPWSMSRPISASCPGEAPDMALQAINLATYKEMPLDALGSGDERSNGSCTPRLEAIGVDPAHVPAITRDQVQHAKPDQ